MADLVTLKRKYSELLETATDLAVECHDLKRQRTEWSRERAYLVDTMLELEESIARVERHRAEKHRRKKEKREQQRREGASNGKSHKHKHHKKGHDKVNVSKGDFDDSEHGEYDPTRRNRSRNRSRSNSVNLTEISAGPMCIYVVNDRPCRIKPLKGFQYCHHHAANNPSTGYVFCQNIDASGRQCQISVPSGGDPLCTYHRKRDDEDLAVHVDKNDDAESKSGANNSSIDVDGSNVDNEDVMDVEECGESDVQDEMRMEDNASTNSSFGKRDDIGQTTENDVVMKESAENGTAIQNEMSNTPPLDVQMPTSLEDLQLNDSLLDHHPTGWTFT